MSDFLKNYVKNEIIVIKNPLERFENKSKDDQRILNRFLQPVLEFDQKTETDASSSQNKVSSETH